MIDNTEKRNSNKEMPTSLPGVGARHGHHPPLAGRGGYLDICNGEKFSEKIAPRGDSRLRELKEIGLATHWLEVAETIGVDNFLAMWKVLSKSDAVQNERHRTYVPQYDSWLRYQRNRVIISLHNDGLNAAEIMTRIKNDLGENIGIDQIKRVIKKAI
ncbi:MAG: hypothetical protein ACU836_15860 [Gammaproteobacteria bacterium]